MTPRKILFWLHLTAGCLAGVVILILCVTGVLLASQRSATHWAESAFRAAPSDNAQRLPLATLLENARDAKSAAPSAIAWRSDPAEPVEVTFARGQVLLLNPYTGAVLGQGAVRTRAFFRGVEDWHRWLAVSADHRGRGRGITGACNLAFLFLVCSGPFLWWPRTWSRAALRAGTRFNGKLAGKARDFNWHNVIGFWCSIPLALIVTCSVAMSYPWANNLVYRITGNQPPGPQPQAAAPNARPRQGTEGAPFWEHLDALLVGVEQRAPGWRTVTLRFLNSPADAPLALSIDCGNGGRPDQRSQLTLDRQTGREVRWETFSSYNAGRRLRLWMRFLHTGEAGGAVGQLVAAVAALGGAFLVWTGLGLAIRRLLAAVSRQGTASVRFRAASPAFGPTESNHTDDAQPAARSD